MKSITTTHLGIVLNSTPHREADLRLSILTAEGLVTITATGAQKPAAKLKAAAQLFTIAEFEITANRLTGARVLSSPMPLTREINRYYLACSIAEVLLKVNYPVTCGASVATSVHLQISSTDPSPLEGDFSETFVLTARAFEDLVETKTSAYKIFIDYFSKLLTLLGLDIELEIPENLGLSAAKKLILQINAAFEEHLDVSIPCVANFV